MPPFVGAFFLRAAALLRLAGRSPWTATGVKISAEETSLPIAGAIGCSRRESANAWRLQAGNSALAASRGHYYETPTPRSSGFPWKACQETNVAVRCVATSKATVAAIDTKRFCNHRGDVRDLASSNGARVNDIRTCRRNRHPSEVQSVWGRIGTPMAGVSIRSQQCRGP